MFVLMPSRRTRSQPPATTFASPRCPTEPARRAWSPAGRACRDEPRAVAPTSKGRASRPGAAHADHGDILGSERICLARRARETGLPVPARTWTVAPTQRFTRRTSSRLFVSASATARSDRNSRAAAGGTRYTSEMLHGECPRAVVMRCGPRSGRQRWWSGPAGVQQLPRSAWPLLGSISARSMRRHRGFPMKAPFLTPMRRAAEHATFAGCRIGHLGKRDRPIASIEPRDQGVRCRGRAA